MKAKKPSVSEQQRATIRRLSTEGLKAPEIATATGLPERTIAGITAWLNNPESWKRVSEGNRDIAAEVVDAVETTFGLERDLQKFLRENIEQLEAGLKIADGGKESRVPSGNIDITAEDRNGTIVVIELKAGEADRDAIGQLLAYMGDRIGEGKPVRGILIAANFSARAKSAARATGNVELKRYGVRFSFGSPDSGGRP